MNINKVLSVCITALVVSCSSYTSNVFAKENYTENPQLISSRAVKVNNNNVFIHYYNDNGKIVEGYEGKIEDVSKLLESKQKEENVPINKRSNTSRTKNYYNLGTCSENNHARVIQSIDYTVNAPYNHTHTLIAQKGRTIGQWWGDPKIYEGMYLMQEYQVSGPAISVSMPAGISVGGSSRSKEWKSRYYSNRNISYQAQHDRVSACISPGLISSVKISVQDGADIYVKSYPYKARYGVKKSAMDVLSGI